ncbi:hypothetical protein D3C85_1141160 [compost metagenome]
MIFKETDKRYRRKIQNLFHWGTPYGCAHWNKVLPEHLIAITKFFKEFSDRIILIFGFIQNIYTFLVETVDLHQHL